MNDALALRRAYARKVVEIAGIGSPRIEAAFAAVPREDHVGHGPWVLRGAEGYHTTPDADLARIYEDVLVGLLPDKEINNGQPSAHAAWLAAADPRPGDHVVHIGAGVGYYTAILAELAGEDGRVTAIEYDDGLARRAASNLSNRNTVQVIRGDGVTYPFAPADVIYVNAGIAYPADSWLDRLKQGGRLVVPLTADLGGPYPLGAMFRFERDGEDFLARAVSQAGFVSCEGLRNEATDRALAQAFLAGGAAEVTRLSRRQDWPEDRVWLRWPGGVLLKG